MGGNFKNRLSAAAVEAARLWPARSTEEKLKDAAREAKRLWPADKPPRDKDVMEKLGLTQQQGGRGLGGKDTE